ncbi:hypothetical protein NWE55_16925 (plasmid) [Myroides albus]|uniref:GOLD domain-containing protein n=1 Tax=Myroides odoratimimus TaxID=76832 RepID=A0AAI8C964_9FLAO|nr:MULTISPECIES: hypothetical protein [Myroides]ALU28437.1 hypothetical protein AS202_19850 [Myroides odoratimimus]UVD81356.1 hypothetical protein NWE55_16925 [Myroides albus]
MKQKILFILTILGSFLALNCSSDDNFRPKTDFQFPFTVKVEKNDTFYANDKGYISLLPEVTQGAHIARLDYEISVKTTNADNVVIYDKENVLKQEEFYPWSFDRFSFLFKKIGKYDVIFTIKNQYGYELEHKEVIDVQEIDFLVSLNHSDNVYPLISKSFILDIDAKEDEDEEVAKNVTYKFAYEYANLDDDKLEVVYNSRKLASKQQVPYNGRDITLKFPRSGEYEIILYVESSQGKKVEKREVIFVDDVKFDFTFSTESKTYPTVRKLFKIRTENITEDIHQKWTFKYEISSSQRPDITYNNNVLSASRDIIYSGEDMYITFPVPAQYDFKITMTNQYGFSVIKEHFFDINFANFEVDLKEIPNELFLSQQYNIMVEPLLVEEIENEDNISYQMKIKYNSSDVRVMYDDSNISSDSYVRYRSNRVKLIPLREGNAEVTFYLKNNQGLEVSQKVILNQKMLKFNLALNVPEEIYPNVPATIKLNLTEENSVSNINYTVKVKSTNSRFSVNYNNSRLVLDYAYTFDPATKDFSFNFQEAGNYVVIFQVENNFGSRKEIVANIDVIDTSYEVRIETPTGAIYPTNEADIKYTILDNITSTYKYKYTISGGTGEVVEVRQGGRYQYPEEWINYVNQPVQFKFPRAGLYILNVEFENQYGKKITARKDIRVDAPTFTANVTASNRNVDQNAELNFNMAVVKMPTDQNITFKVLADRRESIAYAKYNNRNISLGDELIYDSNNLVIGFAQPGNVQLSFEFKNENNVRITKNVDIVVDQVDYQTQISARVMDTQIPGYTGVFYQNPVNLAVNVSSLLPTSNLQIKISNPYLLDINNTISPDMYFRLPSDNNQFNLRFDTTILGNVRNNVTIEIKDNYGNVTEHIVNVPINKMPDAPFISDFTGAVEYDKSGRNRGYTLHNLWIKTFTIQTTLNLRSVQAKYDFTNNHERRTTDAVFTRVNANTYEVTVNPDPAFYYYNRDHNDDWGEITIIAVDELGQETSRKIPFQIR